MGTRAHTCICMYLYKHPYILVASFPGSTWCFFKVLITVFISSMCVFFFFLRCLWSIEHSAHFALVTVFSILWLCKYSPFSSQDLRVNLFIVISVWYYSLFFTFSHVTQAISRTPVNCQNDRHAYTVSYLEISRSCIKSWRYYLQFAVQKGKVQQQVARSLPACEWYSWGWSSNSQSSSRALSISVPGLTHRRLRAAPASRKWKCVFQLCISKKNPHNVKIDLSRYLYLRVINSAFFNCFI